MAHHGALVMWPDGMRAERCSAVPVAKGGDTISVVLRALAIRLTGTAGL
jgi:hypothetical protein